jgi:hypothetical protein
MGKPNFSDEFKRDAAIAPTGYSGSPGPRRSDITAAMIACCRQAEPGK